MGRLARIGGAAAVGLILAVGCGGKGSSSTATTVSGSSTAPTFSGSKDSRFCNLARQFSQSIRPNLSSDPKVLFQQFDPLASQFLSVAPSQIKGDAETVINALKQLEASFKAVNYDASKIQAADVAAISDPKVTAASARINAYDNQVCGVTTAST